VSIEDPYRSPILYDLEYQQQTEDIPHYVQLARRMRGPVLELGCGTGRITLPIAQAGVEVHGMDASADMLRGLEEKLSREPDSVRWRVRYSQGDFCQLAPDPRYSLVILPFNAIHHCPGMAKRRELFRGVRGMLRSGGTFAMDCYLPDLALYARDRGQRYEFRTFSHPVTGEPLETWEEGYWEPEKRIHHVIYVYEDARGHQERVHLRLHMFDQQELRQLVHDAGFTIFWEGSDFQGSPMRPDSLKWVLELG